MRSTAEFSVDPAGKVTLLTPSAQAVSASNIPEGIDVKELESLAAGFRLAMEKVLKALASKKP